MKKLPKISIIIVASNNKEYLKKGLDSISKIDYPSKKVETIVVTDTNDLQNHAEIFIKKNYKNVRVIKTDKHNYSYSNNLGIKKSKGEFIFLLNDDVWVDKYCLKELIKFMIGNKKMGGVGPKILFENRRINWAGHEEHPNFYFGETGFNQKDEGQHDALREVGSLCNAAALYRKKCLKDTEYFDEDFNMYYEDIDFGLNCSKKGWKLFYIPQGIAYHKYHGSISPEKFKYLSERNRLLYVAKNFPRDLSKAIATSHLFYKDIMHEHQLLFDILPDAINKLIKHNDKETLQEILSSLLKELRKIVDFEKHDFLKTAKIFKEKLDETQEKLDKTQEKLDKTQEELNHSQELFYTASQRIKDFYNSKGYKYILTPLWTIINRFKKS